MQTCERAVAAAQAHLLCVLPYRLPDCSSTSALASSDSASACSACDKTFLLFVLFDDTSNVHHERKSDPTPAPRPGQTAPVSAPPAGVHM